MGIQPMRGRGVSRKPLEKSDILTAQAQTKSASEAARYLRVNYMTYKRYAQMYGIFEQHKNTSGKGIHKRKYEGKFGLDEILANQHPSYDRTKLKRRLIQAGMLKEECALCKFNERRLLDGQVPLVLHTIEDPNDLRLKNLRVLCFNCCFLTTGRLSKKLLEGRGDYKFAPGVHDTDLVKATGEDELARMMRDIRNEFQED